MTISVLILTLNEEENLPNCLASLGWCDDVVVLDSYSSDKTEQLAVEGGARFFQRRFDNYAAQRNYGLNEITYKYDWLLMVDGDETVPSELVAEMTRMVAENGNEVTTIYRMRRKDFFLGKWIKRSSGYPTWFGRLMEIGHVRVERSINEEYVTDDGMGYLQEHLYHYPFHKGFSAWLEKHNRYSSMEAELLVQKYSNKLNLEELRSKDPTLRRRPVKSVVYRPSGRPLLRFSLPISFRAVFGTETRFDSLTLRTFISI